MWFLTQLLGPVIPNSSGKLAELIVHIIPPKWICIVTRSYYGGELFGWNWPLFSPPWSWNHFHQYGVCEPDSNFTAVLFVQVPVVGQRFMYVCGAFVCGGCTILFGWALSQLSKFYTQNTLHWRHNDYDGVSNNQPHGCLLNRLFGRRSKKTSKLRVTGLCAENSPGPVNSPHKGPVTRNIFPFDDVIMKAFKAGQKFK